MQCVADSVFAFSLYGMAKHGLYAGACDGRVMRVSGRDQSREFRHHVSEVAAYPIGLRVEAERLLAKDGKARINGCGIVELSAMFLDLTQRDLNAKCGPIGAVR